MCNQYCFLISVFACLGHIFNVCEEEFCICTLIAYLDVPCMCFTNKATKDFQYGVYITFFIGLTSERDFSESNHAGTP